MADFTRCPSCVALAERWASSENVSRIKILPPPDGCSECAELNGLPGGLIGALLMGRLAKEQAGGADA